MLLDLGHSSLIHSERIDSEASFKTRVWFLPLVLGRGVCVLLAQSCLTLPYSIDCGLPVSSVHGISQARILEWAAIPFSRGSSQPRDRTQFSCTASRFFTVCTTRETHIRYVTLHNQLHFSPSGFPSVVQKPARTTSQDSHTTFMRNGHKHTVYILK